MFNNMTAGTKAFITGNKRDGNGRKKTFENKCSLMSLSPDLQTQLKKMELGPTVHLIHKTYVNPSVN